MTRRSALAFALLALVVAVIFARGLIAAPGYTDVFYHLNAANRFASGQGLTDPYIWTYIGALDHLPMPSHLYWMPLTSVIAGLSMKLLNVPGDYFAAQFPFTLMFALTACIGFWLGRRIGGTARHSWVAGLLTLFSGFYTKFWGEIDTFAPYALFGSLCLVVIGIGAKWFKQPVEGETVGADLRPAPTALVPEADRAQQAVTLRKTLIVWFATGALAGLGHLTRADGLLLLIVAVMMIVWMGGHRRAPLRSALLGLAVLLVGYVLVMLPYFARNLAEIGTPLPLGGTQSIWFAEYNDIFNYPPNATPATLFAHGLDVVIGGRREALLNNIGTFVAVEGLIIMTPLMLIGLWRRRRDRFLLPFGLYALGLHLAMTFVFPFPGYRGGLLHSAAALIPFWAVLGVVGLDDVVDWIARRRRRWHAQTAKRVFSRGLILIAIGLSVVIGSGGRVSPGDTAAFAELSQNLPADARILSDDPPKLYYYTGRGGASLPNGTPQTLLDVARRYEIDYVVIMGGADSIPAGLQSILTSPPGFLKPMPGFLNMRVYAIQR
jgi:hypothetical protein